MIINISSHWTLNTKYQIKNTKNFDITNQEGKAVTGGKWRWESTPKIHSDIEFAMNEVSIMSSSYYHHMDPNWPITSTLSLQCMRFVIHSLRLLISIISGVLLHLGRRAFHWDCNLQAWHVGSVQHFRQYFHNHQLHAWYVTTHDIIINQQWWNYDNSKCCLKIMKYLFEQECFL